MKILGNIGITKLIDLIASKFAPKDSPNLTGTPTAETATLGTNTNQIATTAFVQNEISDLVGSAPETLNTLNELATALGKDPNFATTITTQLGTKANASDLDDYLPLAGGTLNGGLTWLGGTNGTDLCGFKFGTGSAAANYYQENFNSMDFGWNWDTGAGSGMAFRNATYGGAGSAQAGAFIFFARNNTTAATQLEGHVDGTLLWQGNVFRLGSHVNITYNASTSSLDFSFV